MLHAKYLSSRVYTSFEEDFLSFPYISLCKKCDPWGGANLEPRDIIYAILVGVHKTMLHAKYLSSRVYTLLEEDFLSFPYISLCKKCDPWGGANLEPRDMIYAILVGVH